MLALVSCRPSSALYTECPSRPVHELSLQFEKATDNVDVGVDAAGRRAGCGIYLRCLHRANATIARTNDLST